MPDKRHECGCHDDPRPLRPCDRPCIWPVCLTEAEHEQLLEELLAADHGYPDPRPRWTTPDIKDGLL